MTKPAEPNVRIAYKPLIRKGGEEARGEGAGSQVKKPDGVNAAFLRAANEDDDGYDPYSDRKEIRPFFEENPWD